MPSIYTLAADFRRDLGRRDREATKVLAGYYRASQDEVKRLLKELLKQMDEERRAGRKISKAWLYRAGRYRTIIAQIEQALNVAGRQASASIAGTQRAAVGYGAQAAQVMGSEAVIGGTFMQTNTAAAEAMIGALGDGSPLPAVFQSMSKQVASQAGQLLVDGVVMGKGPRQIARDIVKVTGAPLARAVRISRTETLRAYRQASLDTYKENADVVLKWEWHASRDRNTCAACLEMDGREFPLEVEFGSHPNCRCTPLPVTEDSSKRIPGAAWFAQQEPDLQDAVLGKAGGAAYRSGRVSLKDFVAYHDDPVWGPTRWQIGLEQALKRSEPQRRAA